MARKKISNKQKELKELESKRAEIENSIKKIIIEYNTKSTNESDADKWMSRLPLESLKELHEFLAGRKKNFNLVDLKARSKLRKDRANKVEELKKVEDQISIRQIDIILEKIKALTEGKGT